MTSRRLDVFCRSLPRWRFLTEAIKHPSDRVNANRNALDLGARVVSITLRSGNNWGSLHEAHTWGSQVEPAPELLDDLADLCEHLDAGVYPTPGSLGQETMRRHSRGNYNVPSWAATRSLRDGLVGGRCDLWDGTPHKAAWEYDRNSAYVAECLEPIPTGPAIRLLPGHPAPWEREEGEQPWFTYYVRCTVVIPADGKLPISPFAIRENASGRVRFPTEPGLYPELWLWRHDIEECLCTGYGVLWQGDGWAWETGEPVLRGWAEWILGKRATAPDRIAGYVKASALAAIGWFAQNEERLTVVDQAENPRDVRTILFGAEDGLVGTGEVVGHTPRLRSAMLHWASWIWSRARLHLYQRAVLELQDGNILLSSNFDSIVTERPSRLALSSLPGEWREIELTNVEQPYIRALVSDQKRVTPGIPREASP